LNIPETKEFQTKTFFFRKSV